MAKKTDKKDLFVSLAERYLERRKRKKYIAKVRQKRKNFFEDWGGALLWAACVVLLLNQYFFQAYRIPSGSMVDTLNLGDMLFVNKVLYGPEAVPGYGKLPGIYQPKRGDIIVFESPEYQSRGVVREIVNRLVYMLTFSFVNLDRTAEGNEAVHFLVKRAIGNEGDFIRFGDEQLWITPLGVDNPIEEVDLFDQLALHNNTQYRTVGSAFPTELGTSHDSYYHRTFGESYRYFTAHPSIESERYDHIYPYFEYEKDVNGDPVFDSAGNLIYRRDSQNQLIYSKGTAKAHNPRFMAMRDLYGFYVQQDYILPLGDNRNNSLDGRSWGTVHRDKILGKVAIRHWPLNKMGRPK